MDRKSKPSGHKFLSGGEAYLEPSPGSIYESARDDVKEMIEEMKRNYLDMPEHLIDGSS